MTVNNEDDLIPFQDVRVLQATAPALLCGIGSRRVWLPRGHISGKLWREGDRGKLFVRRWVARDRQLIDTVASADSRERALRSSPTPMNLHVQRADRHAATRPALPAAARAIAILVGLPAPARRGGVPRWTSGPTPLRRRAPATLRLTEPHRPVAPL